MPMKAIDIINKRQELWKSHQNIDQDKMYVGAAADYIISENGASIRQEIKDNPEYLIEMAFCIVDKNQQTVPFFINKVQWKFLKTLNQAIKDFKIGKRLHLKFLILKGRQQGFTSIITAYQLACSITQKNFAGFTLADNSDNTITIFTDKAKYPFDNLPDALQPSIKYNNRKEFHFEALNSRWRVATAGSKDVGRSKTLNFFHGSEAAFWERLREILTGLNPALTKDSIQVLESTANGFNEFKELWDSDNNWEGLFYEWWETDEYRQSFESDRHEQEFKQNVLAAKKGVKDAHSQMWAFFRCKWLIEDVGLDWSQVYWYYNQWKDYKEDIKQEYPCTPEESFLATGKPIFDIEQVTQRKKITDDRQPIKVGRFTYEYVAEKIIDQSIKWVDDDSGPIALYEDVKTNYPYVIGGDTSGEGSDFFASHVLDNTTGNQVAVVHHQYDEDLYAKQMYCLGRYYNTALIGIEVNFSTYPNMELSRLGYPKMYVREVPDTFTGQVQKKFGFRTTTITRPAIIANLVEVVRDHIELINDSRTLGEMITFIKNENGKPEAQEGKHDDLIISLAIAHGIRDQQAYTVSTAAKFDISKLSKDLQDDYWKAPSDMRNYLLKKWGLIK
ncbi:MAG: hypothetical protein K0Q87_68 [Neobacillus sp.]|nr:hypothetical protein [Neobacillus sp.]